MNLIKKILSFIIVICYLLFPLTTHSQESENAEMAKAMQFFDEERFEEAEPLFKKVLAKNPEDFMVNYFYGACRTENNHFSNSDLELLIKANQEVSPLNINYYFGVQYHARSNWERALKFYNIFTSKANLSASEKQEISEKIQQCYNKINPYEEYMLRQNEEIIIPTAVAITNNNEIMTPDSSLVLQQGEIENDISETNQELGKSIVFVINSEITYSNTTNFRTEDGNSLFEQGNSKRIELDNTINRTNDLRDKYALSSSREEKKLIGQDILALESESYSLKREMTQLFLQAKNYEAEYWQNAEPSEIANFQKELERTAKTKEKFAVQNNEYQTDSATYINPDVLLGNTDRIVPTEQKSENNVVYKIQIGAYSRGLPTYVKRLFDKLSLIRTIENYTDEKGIVVYTTGNLSNYDDAVEMMNQVRQEGVEDAYVVPYFKGKRITLKKAKELGTEK